MDGMLMIVPTMLWNQVKFDAEKFPFHSGAFDYALTLKSKPYERKNYIVPLPVVENAYTFYEEDHKRHGNENDAFRELRMKWKGKFQKIKGYDVIRACDRDKEEWKVEGDSV